MNFPFLPLKLLNKRREEYSKIILFISFHAIPFPPPKRGLREWERGEGEWVSERAERQGGKDQRAIGEMRMIDFKVKMLQVQLVRFALFKKKKKKITWILGLIQSRFRLELAGMAWIKWFRPESTCFGQYDSIRPELVLIDLIRRELARVHESASIQKRKKKKKKWCSIDTWAAVSPNAPCVERRCNTPMIASVLSRALCLKKKYY